MGWLYIAVGLLCIGLAVYLMYSIYQQEQSTKGKSAPKDALSDIEEEYERRFGK